MPTVYSESDDHVPDSSDALGTFDTTGTDAGAIENPYDTVTNVYAVAATQNLEVAQRALDPEDRSVDSAMVTTPTYDPWVEDTSHEDAVQRVSEGLDAARERSDRPYGSAEWFEANTGEVDEEEHQRVESATAIAGGFESYNTDMTGTLDTSNTAGTGHPDAEDVSSAAQIAHAEAGDEPSAAGSLNQAAAQAAGADEVGPAGATTEGTREEVAAATAAGEKHIGPEDTEGDEAASETTTEADAEAEVEDDGDPDGEGYESWTNDELKDELRNRGLQVGGRHDELVQRLNDDDQSE